MKGKIEKLKELSVAREAALNYDYVPNESEADELIDMGIMPEGISKESLVHILKKYEGNSSGNIENIAFSIIDEL